MLFLTGLKCRQLHNKVENCVPFVTVELVRTDKQSAAIPYRWNAAQELEVLLVTSRRKGRWVLPKGSVGSLLPHASAAREALEEAGAVGIIERKPVGVYLQRKTTKAGQSIEIAIPAYPLFVNALLSAWPEMSLRERQWVHWQRAAEVVTDIGLSALLRAFGEGYGGGPINKHAGTRKAE